MLMELFLTVIKMMEEVENQLEQHWRAALKRHMYDLVKKKKNNKNLSNTNVACEAAILGSQELDEFCASVSSSVKYGF